MICPEIEVKRKISSDSRDIILNHEEGKVSENKKGKKKLKGKGSFFSEKSSLYF